MIVAVVSTTQPVIVCSLFVALCFSLSLSLYPSVHLLVRHVKFFNFSCRVRVLSLLFCLCHLWRRFILIQLQFICFCFDSQQFDSIRFISVSDWLFVLTAFPAPLSSISHLLHYFVRQVFLLCLFFFFGFIILMIVRIFEFFSSYWTPPRCVCLAVPVRPSVRPCVCHCRRLLPRVLWRQRWWWWWCHWCHYGYSGRSCSRSLWWNWCSSYNFDTKHTFEGERILRKQIHNIPTFVLSFGCSSSFTCRFYGRRSSFAANNRMIRPYNLKYLLANFHFDWLFFCGYWLKFSAVLGNVLNSDTLNWKSLALYAV